LVAAAACEAGVPAHLLDALVTEESGYNPNVRSPKGAIGMTQLMPDTARSIGVWNAWDVVDNVRGGARYLRAQLDEFKRYDLALGAYNAGPQRVRRFGRVPAIRETLGYVTRILQDVRWSVGQGTFAAVSPPAVDLPPVRVASISAF
jgi:soluble lytic murein transglycosylase-like protein